MQKSVKNLGFRVNTEAYRNTRHSRIDTDEVNTFSSPRLDIGQVGPGCLTQPGLFLEMAQKTLIFAWYFLYSISINVYPRD